MQDFRNLEVWQKAHEFALAVYQITRGFPEDERFGLTSQLRRSVASIGANLAEGCGRGTDAEFARYVQIAMGSASEVEYHLLPAKDLTYMHAAQYPDLQEEITRVKRMLASLLKTLNSKRPPAPLADSR